jgi:hypothetical protein
MASTAAAALQRAMVTATFRFYEELNGFLASERAPRHA